MASKKRTKSGIRNVADFPLDTGMSKPYRIAAFLEWWAVRHPHDFAAYNEVLKAIEGYRHMPRIDSEEVAALRTRIHSVERIMNEKYKRSLVRHRGLGVRATVDDVDMIRNKQVDRVKKVERSITAVVRLDGLIDTSKIPNTPENKPLKEWYSRDVKGIIKQIGDPRYLEKMLPPATKSDEEKKKPN